MNALMVPQCIEPPLVAPGDELLVGDRWVPVQRIEACDLGHGVLCWVFVFTGERELHRGYDSLLWARFTPASVGGGR